MLLTLSSVDPLLRLLETAEEGQESIAMLERSSTRNQINLVGLKESTSTCQRMSGDNSATVDTLTIILMDKTNIIGWRSTTLDMEIPEG